MVLPVLALLVLQSPQAALGSGARTPAYAVDGRLAISLRGDLWVVERSASGSSANAVRVTSGPAWDRDPAWTPDGSWIVFASDRGGAVNLWRIRVGAGSAVGITSVEPERLTTGGPDSRPAPYGDGSLVFVRGAGPAAELWLREAGGRERRFIDEPGAKRSPAVSRDGKWLAYVAERNDTIELRVRNPDGSERAVTTDRAVTSVAWSPDGGRIAFASTGRTAGVWVSPRDGGYLLFVTDRGGAVSWSPDGEWLAVADAPPADIGYNGDPDRIGDRSAGDLFDGSGDLRLVRAPAVPERGERLAFEARVDRAAYNADAFDRVWDRIARLYFGARGALRGPDGVPPADASGPLEQWWAVGVKHRAGAVAAQDDRAFEAVIQAMLRERPAARREAAGRAAVSSAHPLATAAGIEILEAGGNVVDAAAAVSFVLGVVEPDASGIGGYGEMLVHLAGMSEPAAIEFMTRVPEAATLDNPKLRTLPADGPVLANVPGTVAGMALAWKKYGSGRIAWARLLEPAIRIAERGFVLDEAFATTLHRERESFAKYEGSRVLFFRDGRPLAAGDTLRNPDLARTLRAIADGGAEAFYSGDIGRRIADDLSAHGNPIAVTDLARYFAAERRPVRTTYRGHTIYAGPPPVTGGVSLVSKLNLLEQAERGRSNVDDATKLHAMIEAWKLQPSTANRVADPDHWPVDVSPFESKDTARVRWRCFLPARASVPSADSARDCARTTDATGADPRLSSSSGAVVTLARAMSGAQDDVTGPGDCDAPISSETVCRASGTTAFAVADADGNMVTVTQTLGTWGGNFYVSPGLGFLYNDKMRSFGTDPRRYGARMPYARVTTVIAPTLVFAGTGEAKRPLLAAGAAGNAWITAAVYQMVIGVVDHGLGPQAALELPRFLPGGRGRAADGPVIQIEDAFDPDALRVLESMGHRFQRISLRGELRMGYGAAVVIRDGQAIAGADPRRSGAAGAAR